MLWDVPLGTASRNSPFGIPSYLPINIGMPNNGRPVVTAGGLIFIAAATVDLIRAIDVETGEVLWTDASRRVDRQRCCSDIVALPAISNPLGALTVLLVAPMTIAKGMLIAPLVLILPTAAFPLSASAFPDRSFPLFVVER